jgi:SAM-dependent methyltransferase
MKICPCCSSKKSSLIFDFGNQPWCGDFKNIQDTSKIKKYPLKLIMCNECKLVRLNHAIAKKIMFNNTTYLSGVSNELVEHFTKISSKIKKKFNLNQNSRILDIGSNDGTFLNNFKKSSVLGVESTKKLCDISNNKGIKTNNSYFNFNFAKKIKYKFDIIHGSGVMFHLEEINSAFKAIKFLLKENGVLVIEFLYLKNIVDKFYFDQIYHEHLFYYNLETLNKFLKKYNLEIFDFDFSNIHGGQIVAYISHIGTKKLSNKIINEIKKERKLKVNTHAYFKKFISVLKKSKNNAKNILNKHKKNNKIIFGLGAPAKGNTLMNFYGINFNHIDLLVEKNNLRIDTIAPGSNIPIIMEKELSIEPDIFLVLIWNLKKEIKNKIISNFKKTKFIFPKSFLKFK